MEQRPNPKELLKYVQKEEQQQLQGKLKIYLGAAPGVGKTYSMLKDAIEKSGDGLDVVAGIVETHERPETKTLLKNFEILPKKTLAYRGKEFQEFDLDGALKRRPHILLVDEMAHTNAPGARHNKRWQDIMELLERGIDVYTTINVQHIESLNNIVTQITGVVIRETVPDTMLEKAHAIELIDLPPEDLIKRLKEGKVYVSTEAGLAIEHFFRKGNLIALRELALRITAEQVNTEVLLHRHGTSIEKIWPTAERLLVCIVPNPHAPKLIRSTFRMAKRLRTEWTALYVDTPDSPLLEEERRNIIQYLQLVEQLGGQALTIGGTDVVKEVLHFVRDHNITKVILGKKPRSRWQDFFKQSLADELVREGEDIDLYILRDCFDKPRVTNRIRNSATPKMAYLISLLTIFICSTINFFFFKHSGLSTLIMVYFLGIISVSTRGFFGPSLLASVLSVFLLCSIFIPYPFQQLLSDPQPLIMLISMFFVSQVISHLTILRKHQADFLRIRERRTATMHLLSKQLAKTRGVKQLLEILVGCISDVFNSQALALLPNQSQQLIPIIGKKADLSLTPKEQSVAQWVFEMGQIAGLGTQTLPDNESLYVPLLGSKGALGVLRVLPKDPNQFCIPEQLHLLEGFCNQTAMALEVDRLQSESNSIKIQMETDKVRNVLLKSISDNMHIPVIDIMDSADQIIETGYQLNSSEIQALGNNIYDHSKDLNHLINKVSQITRLETTESTPIKKLHSISTLNKVINVAIKSLGKSLNHRTININLPTHFPKIYFNRVFLEQVFFNIIENAAKYTPFNTPIDISVQLQQDKVLLSIEDHGPGLALEEINKIFEKFYRGQAITNIQGMGLGLTICQKIIHLHGGEIWAENRPGGGAIFYFTLPL